MSRIIEQLFAVPAFRRLPSETLQQIAPMWTRRPVQPNEVVWAQGSASQELGVVVSGEFIVLVDEQEVGRVREGEILGEASVFSPRAVRSATLKARGEGELLLLPAQHLASIRANQNDGYVLLLDLALQSLVRRIRTTDLRIAMLSKGILDESAPSEAPPLARLFRALKNKLPGKPAPVLVPLLWLQPNLASRETIVYQALEAAFVAEPMHEGQVIFNEGEDGACGYLLAEGVVDVIRSVRGRRADLLVRLKPGDQFGTITLVARGHRTATCVAGSSGWLYRMDAMAYHALDSHTREAWNESMIAIMGMQIRNANGLLAQYLAGTHSGGPLSHDDYEKLVKAAGCLAVHQNR
jgi:CRP-like cAMP-binding protein